VDYAPSRASALAYQQYRMIHNVYVLLDDSDRRVLRRFGLTLPQYRVLQSLDLKQGRRLTTLSQRLLCAKSTITRLVDQLEEDGLVRRTSDAEDRRALRVVLTDTGADLLERARALHEGAVEHRLNHALGLEEQVALRDLLEKLRDGLVRELYGGTAWESSDAAGTDRR
jgi:DNA-binding MarR family transcriptional regulator